MLGVLDGGRLEVHMRRSRCVRTAFVGLLVVAAISVAAGSGRKPALEERAKTSERVLSEAETSQLASRFPGLRARVQVTGELLDRLFPRTVFYRVLWGRPGFLYLTSITDTSLLPLPSGFDRLLQAYNLEVTDDNKVELAKALVLMAIGDENGFRCRPRFVPSGHLCGRGRDRTQDRYIRLRR